MIVMPFLGGFSNQIFQYAYLRTKFPKDVIVCIGNFKFQKILLLEDDRIFFYDKGNFIFRGVKYICQSLVKIKLIDKVDDKNCFRYNRRRRVVYAEGFFQFTGELSEEALERIKLKKKYIHLAMSEYKKKNIDPNNSFFMHVRLGDYKSFPSVKYPAYIEPLFYLDKIKDLQLNGEFVNIFLQEDEGKYRDMKGKVENSEIFSSSLVLDFYMMACCRKGGVLSASSFSYWAAYFSHIKNSEAKYIAPRYWSGWRMKEWHPSVAIKVEWIEYKNV